MKNKTGWYVAGLGAVVTIVGATVFSEALAAGVIGFGLAHVVLGLADTLRPSVQCKGSHKTSESPEELET